MDFDVYQDGAGKWRWSAYAVNGRIIADGGQGYTRKHDGERAVLRLCRGIRKQRIYINGKENGEVI